MLKNGKWKEYVSVFDYEHRRIVLWNEEETKIESLQVGNPNISSFEFNVHIQFQNDFSEIETTHTKWCHLILNYCWRFRTNNHYERIYLSNCLSVNEQNTQINEYKSKYTLLENS